MKCEIATLSDGSLILSCGGSGMESDLVFAEGCMADDPGLGNQRNIMEYICRAVNEKAEADSIDSEVT